MKCSKCECESVIKQGNQRLCDKHYRFGQMRQRARRDNKYVPSYDELETMNPIGMVCPDCGATMNWRSKDGRSTVASIQHYRDGSLAIVCLSCNVRHASMAGDTYRSLKHNTKVCPSCGEAKPFTSFARDNSRSGVAKRKSSCRECSGQKVNQWRKTNRDKYNEYQRDRRARLKSVNAAALPAREE